MGITSRRNEVDTFLSPYAPDPLHNLTQLRAIEPYNSNDDDDVNHLDIAEGLKDALVRYGFKLD